MSQVADKYLAKISSREYREGKQHAEFGLFLEI